MFTPFENYVGDDGRFSQTKTSRNCTSAPPPLRDKLNATAQYAAQLEQELAVARMELADLKAEKAVGSEAGQPRKIEVAKRYARMLEEASLTVVGAEGRAVVREALEHYVRHLEN